MKRISYNYQYDLDGDIYTVKRKRMTVKESEALQNEEQEVSEHSIMRMAMRSIDRVLLGDERVELEDVPEIVIAEYASDVFAEMRDLLTRLTGLDNSLESPESS